MSYDLGFETIEKLLSELPQTPTIRHLVKVTIYMRRDMQKLLEDRKQQLEEAKKETRKLKEEVRQANLWLSRITATAARVVNQSQSPEIDQLRILLGQYKSPIFK